MRMAAWLTCFWPGAPRLWWRGDFRALAEAVAFAGCLDLVLWESLVWPRWLPPKLLPCAWLLVASWWLASAARALCQFSRLFGRGNAGDQDLFIRAQAEYLRSNWIEAEGLLGQLLREAPKDAEAHLLLASLYRHSRRPDLAKSRLRVLERLDGAAVWRVEIERERRLLERTVAP